MEDNDEKLATSSVDDPLANFVQMDINAYLNGR